MSTLHDILQTHASNGSVPGAVGLVARRGQVEVQAVGAADLDGACPMARDSIFRIASITKPIIAAAVMMLVEDGRDRAGRPGRALAARAGVTVGRPHTGQPGRRCGPGGQADHRGRSAHLPGRVRLPVRLLAAGGRPVVQRAETRTAAAATGRRAGRMDGGAVPHSAAVPAGRRMAVQHLLRHPGRADRPGLGPSVPRVPGRAAVRAARHGRHRIRGPARPSSDRFTSYYRTDPAGGLELVDAPGGQWSSLPAFPSGAGGLVSTADDWYAFRPDAARRRNRRRLAAAVGGVGAADDHRPPDPAQRDASRLFLEGQGWGFGGSVDVEAIDPWNVPGRYGWVGGTGTAAHITASTGTVTILLSQMEMAGPTPPALMRDFWRYAAGA